MSIDPLAFEFSSWTPYHYVHNNPIRLIDPTGMKADSTYEINTKTGEFTVINGNGGDEIDYIQLWNGEDKCRTNCKVAEPFPVVVEDVSITHQIEGLSPYTERYPGYIAYHGGISGTIQTFDDPFTGGIQKASFGVAGFALGVLTTSSRKTNPSVVYAIMKEESFPNLEFQEVV